MLTSLVAVVPAVPPAIGGVETYAEQFTTTMAATGVAVHLVCGNEPRPEARAVLLGNGGSVTVAEHGGRLGAELVFGLLRDTGADAVHAFSHDTMLSAAIAISGQHRWVPLVVTPGEMFTDENDFGRTRSRFVYQLDVAGLFHESRYYADNAIGYGCRPIRADVCSAVAVDEFAAGSRDRGRRMLGIAADRIVVSCPSRYTPRKGQLELIQAMNELPGSLAERMTLVLAGSLHSGWSDYLARLRDEATRCATEVHFVETNRTDMPDLMAASDVIVQPSWKEGLGLSALEAMAAGIPVLLTDVAGFNEFAAHRHNAYVVPPRSPRLLAAGLADLLSSPGLAATLVSNARAFVDGHYHPRQLAERAHAFYRGLLTSKGR